MIQYIQAQKSLRNSHRVLALIGSAFCFAGADAADNASCNGTKAFYSATTGAVCLPTVAVPTATGTHYYLAQLQIVNTSNPLRLDLTSTTEIPPPTLASATFSQATGLLNIPAIEQYDQFGTNRYSINLQLLPNSNPAEFQLINVVAVIANYKQGVTWKPYVGLLPGEKSAQNTLGYAQPFSALDVAVYDFNIKSVGAWNLRETTSTSSGMQAGVYVNSQTNQVALAFRGTEFCIDLFSCSFSQLEESGRDVLADTLLTQGRDSGQFNDAYLAQQIRTLYAGSNIVTTGHSLGGGLAQAVGAALQWETYAFNSSPVPNNYFNDHSVYQFNPIFNQMIHVLSDIHDPVSNTDYSGKLYATCRM